MISYPTISAALFATQPTPGSTPRRPGRVSVLHGVIIQSDARSTVGRLFIRPAEALDLWFSQVVDSPGRPPRLTRQGFAAGLGMHAGLHVTLEDGREYVVEQLCGGWREWFVNGLHWTPIKDFRGREAVEKGGWNVTIPICALRQPDERDAEQAIARLNEIHGRAFLVEDCTAFIGRVFGAKHRIFADSPLLRSLGIDMRSGEPALPLLSPVASLGPQEETLLRAEALRRLPDPVAASGSTSLRQMHHRLTLFALFVAVCALVAPPLRARRRWGRGR